MTYDKNKIYPEYIIYKLCSDECDNFYIGSTRNVVQRRKSHKQNCNNENNPKHNLKVYKNIREFGGWNEWRLVPVEKMENVSRFEAECREEVVRVELNAILNSKRASCGGLTDKEYKAEYYRENKEYMREQMKEYMKENKEEVYRKKREKFDCDCGGKYCRGNKKRHFNSKIHIRYLEQIE
jgi:hypothetical protein